MGCRDFIIPKIRCYFYVNAPIDFFILLKSSSIYTGFVGGKVESEIIDMNKKLAQSELDALLKLIDARNDALIAKKNYYDYDKTIKDKTKDIQALQAQIGALEGVETASSLAF